ncbi:hypothetical protein [Nocardia sp. NPDC004604]|uniref:hypothetical protein n=1 Tax=Nocardia sp. NPDC004604 TaxID=3157013 RepID=UPI0033B0B995
MHRVSVRIPVAEASTNPRGRAAIEQTSDRIGLTADTVTRAIAFAIIQPDTVDVSELVIRSTAQA